MCVCVCVCVCALHIYMYLCVCVYVCVHVVSDCKRLSSANQLYIYNPCTHCGITGPAKSTGRSGRGV